MPAGQTVEEMIARLKALPGVEVVEADAEMQCLWTPNDPYYGLQWGLYKISAPDAWNVTNGSGDVWIAVVDSGIDYLHPDAPLHLWLGYDFVSGDDYPYDDNGHGTHVAGIAAAATNNGTGVAGLCPSCEVVAVKVMNYEGRGAFSDIADGIYYAAYWGAYYGKRTIINLSLGGAYSQDIADAVAYAQGVGALVVAAAGNDGPGAPAYPAALPGVVSVSATNASDQPTSWSRYGDVGAPGEAIYSTVPQWLAAPPYMAWPGTSMACPFVAGAAGLVWSAFPSYSAADIQSRLLAGVDVPSGWNTSYGVGRLNVYKALLPQDPTPFPTPIGGWPYASYLPLVMRQ